MPRIVVKNIAKIESISLRRSSMHFTPTCIDRGWQGQCTATVALRTQGTGTARVFVVAVDEGVIVV